MPGSIISGAFNLGAAEIQAGAAEHAADTAAAAQERALQLQRDIYTTGRSDLAPYREAGNWALNSLINYGPVGSTVANPIPVGSNNASIAAPAVTQSGTSVFGDWQPAEWVMPGSRDNGFYNVKTGDYVPNDSWLPADVRAALRGQPAATTSGTGTAPTSSTPTSMPAAQSSIVYPKAGPSVFQPLYSGEFSKPFTFSAKDLEKTPGYQFTRDEALGATGRYANARGLSLSGGTLMGLEDRAAGLASTRYDTSYGQAYNDFSRRQQLLSGEESNYINRLLAIAGYGQASAAGGVAAGSNYASTASNTLLGSANLIGQAGAAGANAQAAGLTGVGANIGEGVNRLLNGTSPISGWLNGSNAAPNAESVYGSGADIWW